MWVGAESGSQKILDAMDKGTKVEQIYAAARSLHAQGIEIAFFLQFGYPGEDRAGHRSDAADGARLRARRHRHVGVLSAARHQVLRHVQMELGDKQNWVDSDDFAMMYRGPYSSEFYRKLHVVLHKEYRAHKLWKKVTGRNLNGRSHEHLYRAARANDFIHVVYNLATLPIERQRLNKIGVRSKMPSACSPDHDPRSRRQPHTPARLKRNKKGLRTARPFALIAYSPKQFRRSPLQASTALPFRTSASSTLPSATPCASALFSVAVSTTWLICHGKHDVANLTPDFAAGPFGST